MQIVHANYPKGLVKVRVQNWDDLWYLSQIIEEKDIVEGLTFRKIKVGGGEDGGDAVKRKLFLQVAVEKVDFHPTSRDLRVSGQVWEGVEDVPKGSYHTFTITEGTEISIKKEKFLGYQVQKLKEAAENKPTKVLLCALERDNATFALLKKYGFEMLGTLQGSVEKKYMAQSIKKNFYEEIAKLLQDYVARHAIETIIIGSPAFWKEDLQKVLKNHSLPRTILATCFSSGKAAIGELLRRPEIKEALKQDRVVREVAHVEKILEEIAKDGLAAYSFRDVRACAEQGAIQLLALTDHFLHTMRDEGRYGELLSVLTLVEQGRGETCIVSSEHDGGIKLDGLGGIGALLRYKVSLE